MTKYLSPPKIKSIKINEINLFPPSIEGLSTSVAGFIGEAEKGPNNPTLITSQSEYQRIFGGFFGNEKFLPDAVQGFFLNGGKKCYISRITSASTASPCLSDFLGNLNQNTGLVSFEAIEEISLIYSPNAQATAGLTDALITHCESMKNRFAIIDSLKGENPKNITKPRSSKYAALYYPWIKITDSSSRLIPPGGHIAGIYALTDIQKGVHKAPANQIVKGAINTEFTVSKFDQEKLNPQGINCIREFSGKGIMIWGARTLSEDIEYKYINVCRLLMFLKKSIQKGIQWSVFEPNNEKTWSIVTQSINNFLFEIWKNGALMGIKTQEAFFVKCDRTTMTQNDLDQGKLIILIGVAPLKPAEFIVFQIQQLPGQSTTL